MRPSPERIAALHRYFIWANRMRIHFDNHMTSGRRNDVDPTQDIEASLYMSLWYAEMDVVIGGWGELELHDDEVDRLLAGDDNGELLDALRLFRNAAFHYQPHYWSPKMLKFVALGSDSAAWIRELTTALGNALIREMDQRSE